jgi:hypothetical protein
VWPEPFAALWSGHKTFEIRKNDRNFEVGDTLVLLLWDPETETYRPGIVMAEINYILSGGFGLEPGYVCMSLTNIQKILRHHDKKIDTNFP